MRLASLSYSRKSPVIVCGSWREGNMSLDGALAGGGVLGRHQSYLIRYHEARQIRSLSTAAAARGTASRASAPTSRRVTATALETTPRSTLHAATAATATLELTTRDVWSAAGPNATLFNVQLLVADLVRVGGDSGGVASWGGEVDESAVLPGHVSYVERMGKQGRRLTFWRAKSK